MVLDLLLMVSVAPLQGGCRGRRGVGPGPGAVTAGLAGTATGWGCGGQGAGGRTVRLVGHCFASDVHHLIIFSMTSMTMSTVVNQSLEFQKGLDLDSKWLVSTPLKELVNYEL